MPNVKSGRDVAITSFSQHGFLKKTQSGNQAAGVCPFCGAGDHKHEYTFYINRKTLKWDCKSCGKEGGFQTFLREMVVHCKDNFKGSAAIDLSKNRGLKIATLREREIGYNPLTDSYTIPVYDSQKERIWDIRIYDKKRMKSTAGCTVGLYGWECFKKNPQNIWLCEGEWDMMAMLEIKRELGLGGEVVAVPGSGILKSDWTLLFKDKEVTVLYDNDEAGRKGCLKVHKNLRPVVKSIRYLNWPESVTIKGWDIRDQYRRDGTKKAFGFIKMNLKETPPGVDDLSDVVGGKDVEEEHYTGNGLTAEQVYEGYQKWLELPDTGVLDIMFGTAIANRLSGDPLWLFLMGPSGATKSELLMSLSSAPRIVTTTSLTPHSLVSGANFGGGQDPSLLAQMHKRILIIKDFTTILSMLTTIREEIFGILRDVYDGKIEKRFGNGIYRNYDPCHFGIIAGVTPLIEVFTEEHTALGERFLRYRVELPEEQEDQRSIIRKAMTNTTREDNMRDDLKTIGQNTLNYDFKTIPVIPDELIEKVMTLAMWSSSMRSTILRDRYSKEVTHKPFTELATRLAKQYGKLLMGVGMFRRMDVVTNDEYEIVKKVALGTVPSRMENIISCMYQHNPTGDFAIEFLSKMLKLPPITCQRVVENLVMVNMIEKVKLSRLSNTYVLTEKCIGLIEHAEIYSKPERSAREPLVIKRTSLKGKVLTIKRKAKQK